MQQGVVREVLEETGLEVVPDGIVEVFDRITQEESSGRVRYHYVLVDFVCRVAGGTLRGGQRCGRGALGGAGGIAGTG